MADVKEIFEKVAATADNQIQQFIEDRKLLRSLFLEEAEKQNEKSKEKITKLLENSTFGKDEEKDIPYSFEADLYRFIEDWYKKNVCGSDASSVAHNILLSLDESSRRNIEARLLTERKDTLRQIVKSSFWYFSDIIYLDDRAIQKCLREIDNATLAKAMKGGEYSVINKITRNMSKRAATMLLEDMEFMGPVLKKDVYEAQEEFIRIVKKLEEKGEIVVAIPACNDELVV